jgi:hypothetical protein
MQRNTEKCRRLMERVKWLYDLLQLLRSSPPPPQMTMEEGPAPCLAYLLESFLWLRSKYCLCTKCFMFEPYTFS